MADCIFVDIVSVVLSKFRRKMVWIKDGIKERCQHVVCTLLFQVEFNGLKSERSVLCAGREAFRGMMGTKAVEREPGTRLPTQRPSE